MNLGKAREYFSAYYEGHLDRGLREGFERVLAEDAQAQAEYRAFERTMLQLDSLKGYEVETPDDLHERIMARIDRHAWESKQKTRAGGFTWWKVLLPTVAVASVLALALVPWRTPDRVSTSNLVPTLASQAKLDVRADARGVVLNYPAVDRRDIVIRYREGEILETVRLRNQGIKDKVLENRAAEAILLQIDESNLGTTWIAVPGTSTDTPPEGKGTLRDLAIAISTSNRIPVVLQVKNVEQTAQWKIDDSDALGIATKAVETLGLKAELRGDRSDVRTLWILGN